MHSHPSFLNNTTAQGIIFFIVYLPFQRTNFLLWVVSNHHCAANTSDQVRTPLSPWAYFYFITCLVSCFSLICFPNNCPFVLQHLHSRTSSGWTWTDPFWLDLQPPFVSAFHLWSAPEIICPACRWFHRTASSQTSALCSSWSGNQLAHRADSQQEASESRSGSGRRRIHW